MVQEPPFGCVTSFAHDNVTVDLQNRYGFESDDTTPSLGFGLITGKNITLRNVARIQANEDGIIIGSSARDITIENSLIGNPPGSTATQWDYAIENGIAIFEGADGIDINHVQFDRATSAITFLRSSATGDDIRNVTVRNSTLDADSECWRLRPDQEPVRR